MIAAGSIQDEPEIEKQSDESSGDENDEDEDDAEEEEEEIKQSHPSLTPTPPDEEESIQLTSDYHYRQQHDTGPALAPVKSQEEGGEEEEEEDDEEETNVDLDPDYHPEQEYFSDPDFHDERPGKKSFEELVEEQRLRRERLIRSSEDPEPVAGTSFVDEELGEESEATVRSLHEVIEELNEQVEEAESECDQVTASEARADLFVDESTLANSSICFKEESDDEEDVTTPKVVEAGVEVKLERIDSLDDARSEDLDESELGLSLTEEVQKDEVTSNQQLQELENKSEVELEEEEVQREEEEEVREVELVRGNSEEQRQRLSDLIGVYCDRLVKSIQEEALRQVELLVTSPQQVAHLKVSHVFQIDSALVSSVPLIEDKMLTNNRKIYTSSMYYNDQRGSYPTIEQQVEQCRSIARQLEAEGADEEQNTKPMLNDSQHQGEPNNGVNSQRNRQMARRRRASWMFKRRRERMQSFTVEEVADDDLGERKSRRSSLDPNMLIGQVTMATIEKQIKSSKSNEDEEEAAAATDTEYEAPKIRRRAMPTRATTTPMRELLASRRPLWVQQQQLVEEPTSTSNQTPAARFKPFLDWSTMKDIERLKQWSPYGEFNEHNSVSPEICLKLVQDLGSSTTKEVCKKDENSSNSSSKGAKMFERRQLQSSDWVVNQGSPHVPELIVTEMPTTSGEEEGRLTVKSSNQRSRPSITEETCMVADEAQGEQVVVELKPVLTSHNELSPPLELATVTKTASFSASSRRVIECDSPDLLTSHDDDSGDDTDKDDDEEDDESEDEEVVGEMTPVNEVPEPQVEFREEEAAVAARARPQSRSGELHQASLVEWRPRVMTPTWLEAPGPLTNEPLRWHQWRPNGVLHLRDAHQTFIDEESRANQRQLSRPLWAPPRPQRAASLLNDRQLQDQNQRHGSPALSLDLNLGRDLNLNLNLDLNSELNSNLNEFCNDDDEPDLRRRSFQEERGHAPAAAKAFYGPRNLMNEQLRRRRRRLHQHRHQHRTWTGEEEDDDDDDGDLALERSHLSGGYGANLGRARHLSAAGGGTGAEVPTGDADNQHADDDYYPTVGDASDNWPPPTTTCREPRQRPPSMAPNPLPATAPSEPASWRVCVGLARRRRAHKSRLEPGLPPPQVNFALCLEQGACTGNDFELANNHGRT